MTNGWTDIQNADVILAMGGNPAENHPVGFRFVMEAKRNRGAKLVSVDPRFNRTSAVADSFTQIRAGTDIAWLGGPRGSDRIGLAEPLRHALDGLVDLRLGCLDDQALDLEPVRTQLPNPAIYITPRPRNIAYTNATGSPTTLL